jgi:hypothetical protein
MLNTQFFKKDDDTANAVRKLKQLTNLRKAQKAKVLNITPVHAIDIKHMEKQAVGSARAQAEACHMQKIHPVTGCMKDLMDTRKRVVENDLRLKRHNIIRQMMKVQQMTSN